MKVLMEMFKKQQLRGQKVSHNFTLNRAFVGGVLGVPGAGQCWPLADSLLSQVGGLG